MNTTLLLILIIQSTSAAGPKMKRCFKPSDQELQTLFKSSYNSAASILRTHYTCLAVRGRDLYQSASVLVQYNTSEGNDRIKHFEITCKMSELWEMVGTSEDATNSSLFDLKTRYDCFQCTTSVGRHTSTVLDQRTHCQGKYCVFTFPVLFVD